MWAYPERGPESWIHISYIEGENEKHTTLATEVDSIHEWYGGHRRGINQQYQDGIAGANESLVCGAAGIEGGKESVTSNTCVESPFVSRPVGEGLLPNPWRDNHKIKLSGTDYDPTEEGIYHGREHAAIDLKAKVGTEFIAPLDGTLDLCEYDFGGCSGVAACGGRLGVKRMKLSDGRKARMFTCHAWKPAMHPTENRELKHGDKVQAGQVIGYSGGGKSVKKVDGENVRFYNDERLKRNLGKTGGPHFHYKVYIDGVVVNPWEWMQCNSATEGTLGCPDGDADSDDYYKKWPPAGHFSDVPSLELITPSLITNFPTDVEGNIIDD